MDVKKAIDVIYKIHSTINERLFTIIFDIDESQKLIQNWYLKEQNAFEFLRSINRENKIKFWNWIKTCGITNIHHLKESYSIISYIFNYLIEKKIDNSEIRNLLEKYFSDNMIFFIIKMNDDERRNFINWCETWLIDIELDKAKIATTIFYKKKPIIEENNKNISINFRPHRQKFLVAPFQPDTQFSNFVPPIKKISTTPRHISLKYKLSSF